MQIPPPIYNGKWHIFHYIFLVPTSLLSAAKPPDSRLCGNDKREAGIFIDERFRMDRFFVRLIKFYLISIGIKRSKE